MIYILLNKKRRKGHPSIDGWPMAFVLFQKKRFNSLAKSLYFIVSLLKIVVSCLFFQTDFKQSFRLFCFHVAFNKPIKCFLFVLLSSGIQEAEQTLHPTPVVGSLSFAENRGG